MTSRQDDPTAGADRVEEAPLEKTYFGDRQRFVDGLLDWARQGNLRVFPWRQEREPYRLLIAELMLRRTGADQVGPVYQAFLERWPDFTAFLAARDDDIRDILEPLGLRWRAENVIALKSRLAGEQTILSAGYEELVRLPGVGDYVASAVCCFSGSEERPLIDTNSVRVLGRVFGFETGPETRRRKFLRELARALLPAGEAAMYNYAILDLAATLCKPSNPMCRECPLNRRCRFARRADRGLRS